MSRSTNAAASDAAKAVSSADKPATTRRESGPSVKLKSVYSYMRTRILQGGVGPCALAAPMPVVAGTATAAKPTTSVSNQANRIVRIHALHCPFAASPSVLHRVAPADRSASNTARWRCTGAAVWTSERVSCCCGDRRTTPIRDMGGASSEPRRELREATRSESSGCYELLSFKSSKPRRLRCGCLLEWRGWLVGGIEMRQAQT